MSIFSKFHGVAKHNYNYVPPCPCCGSRATGRFVKQKKFDKDNRWFMEESLKNGELIMLVPKVDGTMGFCYNCEYVWPARIQNVWLTDSELMAERTARGTDALYDAIKNPPNKDQKVSPIVGSMIASVFGRR